MLSRRGLRGAERISWTLDDSPSPTWNAGAESPQPVRHREVDPRARHGQEGDVGVEACERAGELNRAHAVACHVDEGGRTHRSLCQTTGKRPLATVRSWPTAALGPTPELEDARNSSPFSRLV